METDLPQLPFMNDLDAHLSYLLRRISNQVSGEFARSLKARSISVAEWVVLSRIAHELGITSSKLTDGLNLTRGAISKIVEKLESKGLVSRESIEGDARVKELYLTDKGTKLLPQLVKIADDNDRRFFEGLTDSEQQILRKVLHKLAAANEINEIPIG